MKYILFFLIAFTIVTEFNTLKSKFYFIYAFNHFTISKGNEIPESCLKLDDFYFINTNTGWLIKGIDPIKKVYKTSNGGGNWFVVFENYYNVFRSIVIKDSVLN